MSLVNLPVPALHNGVSQQSPVVRSTDQGEEQINGWSSLADGLLKRAPATYVNKLMSGVAPGALVYHINRDASERYIVIAYGGQLRVFDTVTGLEQTVLAPAGWGYLASATDPQNDIALTTVADYTFVVNRKAVPAMVPLGGVGDPLPEEVPVPDYYIPPGRPAWGQTYAEP